MSKGSSLLRVGDMIDGRYRIDAMLGDGGMSTIYRATHTVLEQTVAIKIVAPQMRYLPGMVARFLREARAATHLKGQHVVRVLDVGTTETVGPYMVMEHLEGRDLGAILRDDSPIPVMQAVDYIVQACEALAEVHGLGIIHRDLKPANLFVTRGTRGQPFVKLIDFGISRIESALVSGTKALTNPGVVMGSPGYMAPEQMLGTKIDPRADIWGLGAVLYELLTGRRPFEGSSLQATYVASMAAPAKPSALRAGLPMGLDDVVLRCLRPVPGARFANVAQLAAALMPFSSEVPPIHARAHDVAMVFETARARVGDEDSMAWGAESTASAAVSFAPRSRKRVVIGALVAGALAGLAGFGVTRWLQDIETVAEATPLARVPSFTFERVASMPAAPMEMIPEPAKKPAPRPIPRFAASAPPARAAAPTIAMRTPDESPADVLEAGADPALDLPSGNGSAARSNDEPKDPQEQP